MKGYNIANAMLIFMINFDFKTIAVGDLVLIRIENCLFVWLVGFLTSSSTTRLYRGRAQGQRV